MNYGYTTLVINSWQPWIGTRVSRALRRQPPWAHEVFAPRSMAAKSANVTSFGRPPSRPRSDMDGLPGSKLRR